MTNIEGMYSAYFILRQSAAIPPFYIRLGRARRGLRFAFFQIVVQYKRGPLVKGQPVWSKKKLQSFTTENAENAEKENLKIISVISAVPVVK